MRDTGAFTRHPLVAHGVYKGRTFCGENIDIPEPHGEWFAHPEPMLINCLACKRVIRAARDAGMSHQNRTWPP